MPESPISGRNGHREFARPTSADDGQEDETRGMLRLRVVKSLPPGHQDYFFEEVRKLASQYLRNKRVPSSDVVPEELVSEICRKLFGTVSLPNEQPATAFPDPSEWSTDPVPNHDGRVDWLIKEIGGLIAVAHRHQDIMRERFGRDYKIVQTDIDDEIFEGDPAPGADGDDTLNEVDLRLVWRGLRIASRREFPPGDRVSDLLQLMERTPDLFDGSSNGRWPITEIVALLTRDFPEHAWDDDLVENAKRRLLRWVKRLKQENRLNTIDLEALFARIARQSKGDEPGWLPDVNQPRALS